MKVTQTLFKIQLLGGEDLVLEASWQNGVLCSDMKEEVLGSMTDSFRRGFQP